MSIADTLVNRLIQDAGTESGNLPLLAFVLRRLFDQRQNGELCESVYDSFGGREAGGMKGALAEYATGVQQQLGKAVDQLPDLFERLLVVNVEGTPTRQRVLANALPTNLQAIVETLVKVRLLSKQGEGDEATVSVAHEKLFEAWPALTHWIGENEEALRTLAMAELDAGQWRAHHYDIAYLWHPDRLQWLQTILQERPQLLETRPQREIADEYLGEYAWPQTRLVTQLGGSELDHMQRATIGSLLAQLGDPRLGVGLCTDGVPDIEWVKIPGGGVVLKDNAGEHTVTDFEIALYPITHVQFQAFIDDYGYDNLRWWQDLERRDPASPSWHWNEANAPSEAVSWYEAVAFCRWLSDKLGYMVRLPTEFEWQQAATGGDNQRIYPWGPEWDSSRCNSVENRMYRVTVVGLYPHGTWPGGPLDMAGNVWEWCLNKYDQPNNSQIGRRDYDNRVLHGGSWGGTSRDCRAASRLSAIPGAQSLYIGFRVLRPSSNEH
jgi:formylglycine-generating enzyme required for sulfatase activity